MPRDPSPHPSHDLPDDVDLLRREVERLRGLLAAAGGEPAMVDAEALFHLTAAINQAEGLENVFEQALEAIGRLLQVERASILLYDPEGVMRFRAWRGLSETYRQAVDGHSPWRQDEPAPVPIFVDDVRRDVSLADYRPVFDAERISALGFVPLLHQGRLLGKFMVYSEEPRSFTPHEIHLAETVAGQIAQAVARARLLDDERAIRAQLALRARQQEALAHLGRRALEGTDLADLLEEVVRAAVEVLGVEFGSVLELLPESRELRVCAGVGWRAGVVGEAVVAAEHGSQAGFTLFAGDLVIVEDLATETRFTVPHLLREHGVISGMSAVILGPEGPFGVLGVHSTRPRAFNPDDVQFVQGLTNVLGAAIGRFRGDAALRDSGARLAGIVSSAMDAIISVGEDQRVLLFNAAAEAMFRCSAAEAIGAPIDRFVPDRFRERHEHHIRAFAETGATGRRMGALGTLTALRTDGEEFPIEATISQVTIGGRRIFTVVVRDVTERQRAAEALEEANRRKDEFLALLGHELRNPLAPILTALHLMHLKGETQTERERQVIERQVVHLTRLVDDLLDVSRITRGKLELKTEPSEVRTVLARAIEMASPLIEKRAHRLVTDVPRELAALVDPQRFAQVLANLLTNAAKYTPEGGTIEVRAYQDGAVVAVAVRDTGRGIPREALSHLFDSFFQVDRTLERGHGGLGLGLALVKNLVELHGGTVEVESAGAGQGSQFTVRVPAAGPVTAAVRKEEATAPAAPVDPARLRRVLVVDDIPDVAEGLADILRAHGHEVEVAHDGPQALALANVSGFDVALLDLGLPVMDGFELARHLLADGGRVGRLVAVTGYGQEADRARSLAAGFSDHLTKPVSPERLLAVVETAPRVTRAQGPGAGIE